MRKRLRDIKLGNIKADAQLMLPTSHLTLGLHVRGSFRRLSHSMMSLNSKMYLTGVLMPGRQIPAATMSWQIRCVVHRGKCP